MNFQKFVRQSGSASMDPAVGSDGAPAGQASTAATCAFSLPVGGKNGVTTLQQLALAYVGPGASVLPVDVYTFDQATEQWVVVGSADLANGTLAKVTLAVPLERAGSEAVDVYVRIANPGGLTSGVYTILVAADSSAAPASVGGSIPVTPVVKAATLATTAKFTVGTAAGQLSGTYPLGSILVNEGSSKIYLGGSSAVTTSGATGGIPILPGGSFGGAEIQDLSILWAIAPSSGQDLRALGLS